MIDEIDNWFGGKEEERVNDLDLDRAVDRVSITDEPQKKARWCISRGVLVSVSCFYLTTGLEALFMMRPFNELGLYRAL